MELQDQQLLGEDGRRRPATESPTRSAARDAASALGALAASLDGGEREDTAAEETPGRRDRVRRPAVPPVPGWVRIERDD